MAKTPEQNQLTERPEPQSHQFLINIGQCLSNAGNYPAHGSLCPDEARPPPVNAHHCPSFFDHVIRKQSAHGFCVDINACDSHFISAYPRRRKINVSSVYHRTLAQMIMVYIALMLSKIMADLGGSK